MSRAEFELSWLDRLLVLAVNWILKFNFIFSRLKISGEEHLIRAVKSDRPVFVALWHGRMLFSGWAIRKYNIVVLVSSSRDGEIITRIVRKWGLGSIRGSSKKGGRQALKEMTLKMSQPDSVLAVTMDGPTGPRHVAKLGSLSLAIKKNAIIIPTSGTSTRVKTFTNSWDRQQIPKPFGTVHVRYGEPIELDSNMHDEEVAKLVGDAVIKLEQELDDLVS
ncbi:lysophospholipid acyltransferase family protein [Candidatus Neomarinimicrobiota bacterium]